MNKKIKFISTNSVIPISLTGNYCELSCKHCDKKYLNSMKNIDDLILGSEKIKKDKDFALISGGSLKNGSVPFYKQFSKILQLKNSGYHLNAHTGYIPEKYFEKTLIFDSISIDIVGNDKILKEIYNIEKSKKYFYENILKLAEYLSKIDKDKPKIVPHITIGIFYGENSNEEESIDFIKSLPIDKLVLNIIIPTKNTSFETINNVPYRRVIEIYEYARKNLQDALIYLGCMRPFGEYRDILDATLISEGIDGIVNPSKKTIRQFEELDRIIENINGCCALL